MSSPQASEADVFREFVAKLMSLQKQWDSEYHEGKYLRDRFMTATDILYIQVVLRDRMLLTAQKLVSRAVNRLSEKAGTADSSLAHYSRFSEVEDLNHAMYTLRKGYGGSSMTIRKQFGNRGSGERCRSARGLSRNDKQRNLCPSWMRGVEGFFVCSEEHLARPSYGR